MASCEVKFGTVETSPDKGKEYAKISVSYDIVVDGKKVHIDSVIPTDIEIPFGGTLQELTDFRDKIATRSFFANQQVQALFTKSGQTQVVDEKMVKILKNPSILYSIKSVRKWPWESRRVVTITVGQGAGSRTLSVHLKGKDKILKKFADGTTKEPRDCKALEEYTEKRKTLEEFARRGGSSLPDDNPIQGMFEPAKKAVLSEEVRLLEEGLKSLEKKINEFENLGDNDPGRQTLLREIRGVYVEALIHARTVGLLKVDKDMKGIIEGQLKRVDKALGEGFVGGTKLRARVESCFQGKELLPSFQPQGTDRSRGSKGSVASYSNSAACACFRT